MDETPYERIEAELKARGLNMSWLAKRMGYETARLGNWKARGVPRAEYQAVAEALGKTMDWVANGTDAGERRAIHGSAMAQRIAQEFDSIGDDDKQLDAFASIIAVITRARDI